MLAGSKSFKENAAGALEDASLQGAPKRTTPRFAAKRRAAMDRLAEFEALRGAAMHIKNRAVAEDARQAVASYKDAFDVLRLEGGAPPGGIPRNVVTGPPRSAGIEQTPEPGAPGPRRPHVLVIDG